MPLAGRAVEDQFESRDPGLLRLEIVIGRRFIDGPNSTPVLRQFLGMASAMTNNALGIYGVDLLWDREVDVNLRALVVNATGGDNGAVQFWPMADGIVSGTYQNRDDWDTHGRHALPPHRLRRRLRAVSTDVLVNPDAYQAPRRSRNLRDSFALATAWAGIDDESPARRQATVRSDGYFQS